MIWQEKTLGEKKSGVYLHEVRLAKISEMEYRKH